MSEAEEQQDNENLDLNQLLFILQSVKKGDLSLRMPVANDGVEGQIAGTLNDIIDMNTIVAAEIIKFSKEFGAEGKLGTKIDSSNLEGIWKSMADSVNMMSLILTAQLRNISEVAKAVSHRDMTKKISIDAEGEMLEVKNTMNEMVEQLSELEQAIKE